MTRRHYSGQQHHRSRDATCLCHTLPPLSGAPRQLLDHTLLFRGHTRLDTHRALDPLIYRVWSIHQRESFKQRWISDSPILSTFLEAGIKISPYYPFIQLRSADVLHTVQGILMSVILHEAKATGCFVEAVEAHD